jgi:Tfp pilus assembly protein PilF
MRLAEAQLRNKDFDAASRTLKKVLQIDPQSLPAQNSLDAVGFAGQTL